MGGCSGGVFACLALASALSLSPVGQQAQATTATSIPGDDAQHRPAGINWVDGSVDQAFERAQREQRLVFLYWGAVWCPPCNQLKATVFRSPGFIERMRSFVPVYIDGDAPGAQALGARFQVIGYPTTLVLRADGPARSIRSAMSMPSMRPCTPRIRCMTCSPMRSPGAAH